MLPFHYREGIEAAPGYRLVHLLGRGGFGQVWKATGPGNVDVALKIIQDFSRKKGAKELRSLQLLKGIRHPNIVPVNAIWLKAEDGSFLTDFSDFAPEENPEDLRQTRLAYHPTPHDLPSELLIAMGLADMSLSDRLLQCLRKGLPGIPAGELLSYMSDSAKALDFLNKRHNIQHCDIKPQNILILGDAAQVCDFGLAKAVSNMRNTSLGAMTVAYAAPEVFMRRGPTSFSDQYSLAISYYELRTGHLPFHETNVREVLDQKERGDLDLSMVSEAERQVLTRAVAPEPERRFPDLCTMVEQLRLAVGRVGLAGASGEAPDVEGPPAGESPEPANQLTEVAHRLTLPQSRPRSSAPPRESGSSRQAEMPSSASDASKELPSTPRPTEPAVFASAAPTKAPTAKGKSTTGPVARQDAKKTSSSSAPPEANQGWLADEAALGYKRERLFDKQGHEQSWVARGPGGEQFLLFERPLGAGPFAWLARYPQLLSLEHPHLHRATDVWVVADKYGVLPGREFARAPSAALSRLSASESPRLVWCGEFLGESLHHKMRIQHREKGAGIPASLLLDYMEQIASAVDFLNDPQHAVSNSGQPASEKRISIQHGNLRPCHFLLRGGQVFLANLSHAVLLDGAYGRPAPDVAFGHHKWIAPEVRSGAISRWSDQFSLAVTYVEMRSGVSASHGELKSKGLSRHECEVLRRAGMNDPASRFSSCRELVEALREANRASKTSARPAREKAAQQAESVAATPTALAAGNLEGPPPVVVQRALSAEAAPCESTSVGEPQSAPVAVDVAERAADSPAVTESRPAEGDGGPIDLAGDIAPQTKTISGMDTLADDHPAPPQPLGVELGGLAFEAPSAESGAVEASPLEESADRPLPPVSEPVADGATVWLPLAEVAPGRILRQRWKWAAAAALGVTLAGALLWIVFAGGSQGDDLADAGKTAGDKKGADKTGIQSSVSGAGKTGSSTGDDGRRQGAGKGAQSTNQSDNDRPPPPNPKAVFIQHWSEATLAWPDDRAAAMEAAAKAESAWRQWRAGSTAEAAERAAQGQSMFLMLARGHAHHDSPDWRTVRRWLNERESLNEAASTRVTESQEAQSQQTLHSLLAVLAAAGDASLDEDQIAERLVAHRQLSQTAKADAFWSPDEQERTALDQLTERVAAGQLADLREELFVAGEKPPDFVGIRRRLAILEGLGSDAALADVARAECLVESLSPGEYLAADETGQESVVRSLTASAPKLSPLDRGYGEYVRAIVGQVSGVEDNRVADAADLAAAAASHPSGWGDNNYRRQKAAELLAQAAAPLALDRQLEREWDQRLTMPFGDAAPAGRLARWLDALAALTPGAPVDAPWRALASWRADPPQQAQAFALAKKASADWTPDAWRLEHAPVLQMFCELAAEDASLSSLAVRSRLRLAQLALLGGPGAPEPVAIYESLLQPAISQADSLVKADGNVEHRSLAASAHAEAAELIRRRPYEPWTFEKGVYPAVFAAYSRAIELDPTRADYLAGRAWARLRTERTSLAAIRSDASAALKLDGTQADALSTLGAASILESRGTNDLSARLKLLEEAVAYCTRAIENAGESRNVTMTALVDRSNANLELGNFIRGTREDKRPYFERARDDARQATMETWSFEGDAYHALGNALEDLADIARHEPEKNYRLAIQAFGEAINRHGDGLCWMGRGRCRYKQAVHEGLNGEAEKRRLLEEAEADLAQAIQAQPAPAEAHHWMGKLLDARGELDAASQSHQTAFTAAPTRDEFIFAKAIVDKKRNRPAEMHRAFEQAVLTAEGTGSPRLSEYLVAWAVEIDPEKSPADVQQSLSRAAAALEKNSSLESLYFRGLTAETSGAFDKAVGLYTQAISLLGGQTGQRPPARSDASDWKYQLHLRRGLAAFRGAAPKTGEPRAEGQRTAIADLGAASEAIKAVDGDRQAYALALSARLQSEVAKEKGINKEWLASSIEYYRRALQIAPAHDISWQWRYELVSDQLWLDPSVYRDPGRRQEAIQLLDQAMSKASDPYKPRIDAARRRVQAGS